MFGSKKSSIKWTDVERQFEKEYSHHTAVMRLGLSDSQVKTMVKSMVRSAWEQGFIEDFAEHAANPDTSESFSPLNVLGRAVACSFLTMYSVGLNGMPEAVKKRALDTPPPPGHGDDWLESVERGARERVQKKGKD